MRQTLLQRAQLWLSVQSRRINIRQLTFILAIIIGLVAGGVTCLFEWLLELIKHGLTSWFAVEQIGWLYLVYPAVGIILATIFVRFIIKDDISEGVTKVLKAMSTNSSAIKPHNCYSSVVGGALTIGFGGSVGPEAPIVLTGAAIGSNIGRMMKLNYRNLTLMLACGVAAALSAIFKAPITGVIFVMEILLLDMSMTAIIPLII
ncbi:MAG: chloride channel protein, partial [Tidjanibacter sp.]|nr:chloride channel protein [Tidjanibacter sp.]